MPRPVPLSMPARPTPLRAGRVAVWLTLVTGLLAGCGSAPPGAPPVSAPPAARSTTPPPAAPATSPAASPVPAPAVAMPPAVSARFPEPAVSYRTPGLQTGRSMPTSAAEVQFALQSLARSHPSVARLIKIGDAAPGVADEVLLFSRSSQATPAALKADGRATVLLFGPQGNEAPAATEALLAVAQELAQGRLQRLLDRVNVIVWARVPAAPGDVDDDHLVLKAPRAQSLARVVREYQPLVVAEVAEYLPSSAFSLRFGAVERHDALVQYAATGNLAPFVTKAADEWFREPLFNQFRQGGLSADWHYALASDAVERRLSMGSPRPDSSRNAQGLKNAVSLVIESRGEPGGGRVHFKRRVHTLVTGLGVVLQSAADRGADLSKLRQYVDAEASSQACKGAVVLESELTPSEYTLRMLDATTGAELSRTVSWDSALALRDARSRPRPCGYWLAADQAEAVSRLRLLGLRVDQIVAKGVVQGDAFLDGKPVASLLDLPPESFYVPLSQPWAALAVAALEPDTAHSYVARGVVTSADKVARVTAWPGTKMIVLP